MRSPGDLIHTQDQFAQLTMMHHLRNSSYFVHVIKFTMIVSMLSDPSYCCYYYSYSTENVTWIYSGRISREDYDCFSRSRHQGNRECLLLPFDSTCLHRWNEYYFESFSIECSLEQRLKCRKYCAAAIL